MVNDTMSRYIFSRDLLRIQASQTSVQVNLDKLFNKNVWE